jgi:hypothetical protein
MIVKALSVVQTEKPTEVVEIVKKDLDWTEINDSDFSDESEENSNSNHSDQ